MLSWIWSATDEAHATTLAKQVLSYRQGDLAHWDCDEQAGLRAALPADRRFAYDVRNIINTLADNASFLELTEKYGTALVTGFMRIEGRALGVMANDCRGLGGALDCDASDKAARFLALCDKLALPVVSLCDTPGFMVGPESEVQGAPRRMGGLFKAGARLRVPLVTIILRKAYGLGAMAMAGGSFKIPSSQPPGPAAKPAPWAWKARSGWASRKSWLQRQTMTHAWRCLTSCWMRFTRRAVRPNLRQPPKLTR